MLDRFKTEHTHDEDEVRFIIAGRGIFHIHPDGRRRAFHRGRGRRHDSRATRYPPLVRPVLRSKNPCDPLVPGQDRLDAALHPERHRLKLRAPLLRARLLRPPRGHRSPIARLRSLYTTYAEAVSSRHRRHHLTGQLRLRRAVSLRARTHERLHLAHAGDPPCKPTSACSHRKTPSTGPAARRSSIFPSQCRRTLLRPSGQHRLSALAHGQGPQVHRTEIHSGKDLGRGLRTGRSI